LVSSVTCARIVDGHSTRPERYSTISRLSLREWFVLMLLFLGLHNSCLGLSWLIGRSYMPIFRALKKIMHKLRNGAKPVRMVGLSGATRSTLLLV